MENHKDQSQSNIDLMQLRTSFKEHVDDSTKKHEQMLSAINELTASMKMVNANYYWIKRSLDKVEVTLDRLEANVNHINPR
jgi:predicted nuclease with TOPRIM domain